MAQYLQNNVILLIIACWYFCGFVCQLFYTWLGTVLHYFIKHLLLCSLFSWNFFV